MYDLKLSFKDVFNFRIVIAIDFSDLNLSLESRWINKSVVQFTTIRFFIKKKTGKKWEINLLL